MKKTSFLLIFKVQDLFDLQRKMWNLSEEFSDSDPIDLRFSELGMITALPPDSTLQARETIPWINFQVINTSIF